MGLSGGIRKFLLSMIPKLIQSVLHYIKLKLESFHLSHTDEELQVDERV